MSLTNPIPHSRIATIGGNISSCNCNKRKTKVTQTCTRFVISHPFRLGFPRTLSLLIVRIKSTRRISARKRSLLPLNMDNTQSKAEAKATAEPLVEVANYALTRSAIIFSPENICLRGLSGVTFFCIIIRLLSSPPTLLASLHSSMLFSTSHHLQRLGSRICFILSHRHTQWVNVQHQPEYGW